jgi:hypothetical protein
MGGFFFVSFYIHIILVCLIPFLAPVPMTGHTIFCALLYGPAIVAGPQ